eukprot:1674739-Rhodomonas_salina.1
MIAVSRLPRTGRPYAPATDTPRRTWASRTLCQKYRATAVLRQYRSMHYSARDGIAGRYDRMIGCADSAG